MTGFGQTLSDADLLALLRAQQDVCVRVMAMPEQQRRAAGPKGEASPEQAACLNAVFAHHAQREADRRGLVT